MPSDVTGLSLGQFRSKKPCRNIAIRGNVCYSVIGISFYKKDCEVRSGIVRPLKRGGRAYDGIVGSIE